MQATMRTIGRLVAIAVVAVALLGALAGPESTLAEKKTVKMKSVTAEEHKEACAMEGGDTTVEGAGVAAAPEPTATPKANRDAAPAKSGIVKTSKTGR
jgi:hypothetical protein